MATQTKVLRAISVLEATKGSLAVFVGLALHELGGRKVQFLFESLVSHLHLNPASEAPSVIHHAISTISDSNINLLALGSVFYAAIRFVEAFGLWRGYAWTEWFALASGAIYLPFEIYGLLTRGHWFDGVALVINLVVVIYMALLIKNRREEARII